MSPLTALTFQAKGMDTGAGGFVWLNHTLNSFDILTVVNVDAGPNAPWNTTGQYGLGSIRINNVTCREWKYDGTTRTWPMRYWVAKGNTTPNALDNAPVIFANDITKISATNRTSFAGKNVELFVFAGNQDFGGFTGQVNDVAATGGLTWRIVPGGSYIYVSPWESGSRGAPASGTYTAPQYTEVSAHELGHAYSITNTNGLISSTSGWSTALDADITALNNASPCNATSGVFRNVNDLNNNDADGNPLPVCVGTTLRSNYSGDNYAIAQTLDPAFTIGEEFHAQMFAYAEVGNTDNGRPMFDQIVANGYFQNLLTLVRAEVNN